MPRSGLRIGGLQLSDIDSIEAKRTILSYDVANNIKIPNIVEETITPRVEKTGNIRTDTVSYDIMIQWTISKSMHAGGFRNPPQELVDNGSETILVGLEYVNGENHPEILYYDSDDGGIHVEYGWDQSKIQYGNPILNPAVSSLKDFWLEWEIEVINKTYGDQWTLDNTYSDGSGLIAVDANSWDGFWTILGLKGGSGTVQHIAYTMDYWTWTKEEFPLKDKFYYYMDWHASSKTLNVWVYDPDGNLLHSRTFVNQDDNFENDATTPLQFWSQYRDEAYMPGGYKPLPLGWSIVSKWRLLRGYTM